MRKLHFLELTVVLALAFAEMAFAQGVSINKPVPVTVSNFVRAETDYYFGQTVTKDGFGLSHTRQMVPIDKQDVVRINRDTLYSSGVFDLEIAADDYTSQRGKALHVYAGHIGGSLHG